MRNPILSEIRRIRVRQSREAAKKKPGQAVAESYELLHKVCDVVIDEKGESHYIANAAKMHEVLIAPRLAKEAARAKSRARRRASSSCSSQPSNTAQERP